MNTIKYTLWAFLFFLVPGIGQAQFTETKEINKRFAVNPETRIEIKNKYGKIELNTWDTDSVVIEIKIRVEEKKLSKLEKSMEQIDFDFTDSQHFLIIRTVVGENMSTLEKEFFKFKESLLQSDGNMQIDYKVWLPSENDLKIENKYGDVYIGDYKGEVEIDLSNGNLKSHDFEGRLNLILNFADATINQTTGARIECNYSNVDIKKAGDMRVISKSSSFEIQQSTDLEIDSRRDKYRIEKVDLLNANGSFTNFRINMLTDRLTFRTEYSDIDVRKTVAEFGNILIESKSTDIDLYFEKTANFAFEITHAKTDIVFDDKISVTEKKVLDEKEGKTEIIGQFGNITNAPEKLLITATSGQINIFSE